MTGIDGWTPTILDELVEVDRETLSNTTSPDFSFFYIDIGSVTQSHINLPAVETTFREAPSRARKIIHYGDVLMSTVRPNLKAFAYFDHTGGQFVASTGFAVLSARKGTDSRFVLYLVLSDDVSRQIEALVSGSNYPAIRPSAVRSLSVLKPPYAEQASIADILSKVDLAIEQTEELIAKHQRIKAGLMQDLLTRGIDKRGKLRSKSTHRFKDSLFGRIPVDWDIASVESLSEFVTSGSRGWARFYAAEGSRFLRIGDLTRDHINLRSDDMAFVNPPASSEGRRTAVETGDLLISITADLGIVGVIPENFGTAYVNQHIALVRVNPEAANPRFVGWFLSSRGGQRQFEELNESGAKAGLNLPTIRRLKVPIPSDPIRGREEQDRIVAILDESTKCIEDALKSRGKLMRLRSGLMQDLLSGNRRVTPLLELESTQ